MIVHQADGSNLMVTLDPKAHLATAWYGYHPFLNYSVQADEVRAQVREVREWIVKNDWWRHA